jgi:Family of unknown function (DUF6551)
MSRTSDQQQKPKTLTFPSKFHLVPMALLRRPTFLQKEFRESRAQQMALNFKIEGLGRLIVNHRDGVFLIIDGCHRHYALLKNDFGSYDIECEVYENLSDEEMAQVFLLHAKRRVMAQFEKFNVNCEANTPRECEIRRVVESNKLKISREREVGCVSAVAALIRVYDACGSKMLGMVLRTLNRAFAGDYAAFDGPLMEAIGQVFNRYNGRTSEDLLTERLSTAQGGVRAIYRRAENQRVRTGNQRVPCIAAAIVELYNRGLNARSERRLASWWKHSDEDLPTETKAATTESRARRRTTTTTPAAPHDLHV